MRSKGLCPICGRVVDITRYGDNYFYGMEEESFSCGICGYTYEYAYGSYRELLDGIEYRHDDSHVKSYEAYNKMKSRWRNGAMTFKGMLSLIFSKSVKPDWYLKIPWYRRFRLWRHSLANPFLVIKIYIKSKRRY